MKQLTIYIILFFVPCFLYAQKVKEYWPNGNIKYKGTLKQKSPVGSWKEWYETGELESVAKYNYHKGTKWPDGVKTGYYKDGKKKFEHYFLLENNAEKRTDFFPNGIVKSTAESKLIDKRKSSAELSIKRYNMNSNLAEEELLKTDSIKWLFTSYYPDGKKSKEAFWYPDTILPTAKKQFSFLDEWLFASENGSPFFRAQAALEAINPNTKLSGSLKIFDEKGKLKYDSVFYFGNYSYHWEYVYDDSLIYSNLYWKNDTLHVFNERAVYNIAKTEYIVYSLPDTLPSHLPDGKWIKLFPLEKKLKEVNGILIDLKINKPFVACEVIYKNGMKEGKFTTYHHSYYTKMKGDNVTMNMSGKFENKYFERPIFVPIEYGVLDTLQPFIKGTLSFSREYNMGIKEGYWRTYIPDENGIYQTEQEKLYKDGFQVYLEKRHPFTKTLVTRHDCINKGCRDRDLIEYYYNGIRKSEQYYRDGKQDGVWKFWDPEGILLEEIIYVKGEKEGWTKAFDPEQNILRESLYKKGKAIHYKEYKDGKLLRNIKN